MSERHKTSKVDDSKEVKVDAVEIHNKPLYLVLLAIMIYILVKVF